MLEVKDITSDAQMLKEKYKKLPHKSDETLYEISSSINSDKSLTIYTHDIMAWYDEDRLLLCGLSHPPPLFLFNQ